MAPLTRSRANADGMPGPLAATYYGRRASLGLIITEGTQSSADGQGYPNTPGIHTPEQIAGRREVADAVHAGGGTPVIQLMHVGRMSHPDDTPHHRQPAAPSTISADQDIFTATGPKKTPLPREPSSQDTQNTIADFRHAAASALAVGADGVEIHGANGYLLHQFLGAGEDVPGAAAGFPRRLPTGPLDHEIRRPAPGQGRGLETSRAVRRVLSPGRLAAAGETAIHLGPALLPASCGLPVNSGEQPSDVHAGPPRFRHDPILTLLRVGFT